LLDGLEDLRAFLEHCFAIDITDVVQIDIDRESRKIEIEEVEGRSAFEYELSFEKGVFVEFDEQLAQA
jgi:hypothetical protein